MALDCSRQIALASSFTTAPLAKPHLELAAAIRQDQQLLAGFPPKLTSRMQSSLCTATPQMGVAKTMHTHLMAATGRCSSRAVLLDWQLEGQVHGLAGVLGLDCFQVQPGGSCSSAMWNWCWTLPTRKSPKQKARSCWHCLRAPRRSLTSGDGWSHTIAAPADGKRMGLGQSGCHHICA
jgi:hypothetical protein